MPQIYNPYLPEYEYIPDGEPHVFGDRIYLYGSHDRFGGKKFCLNDYVCYSAPLDDLTDWRYEGEIYNRREDPRLSQGRHEMWAPDVVQGTDGRYYLYYCLDDKMRSVGVAVCDTPAGTYHFYGLVKDEKGGVIGEREGDTIAFDPGVFADEDGRIYLYSGNGPRTRAAIGKEPKASVVMELCDDMLTIKTEPKKLLPMLGEAEGTGFEGHEFFEASSIRRIRGKYYLVYSSVTLHELCYAISDRPDGDYRFGGVLVSNCDVFSDGRNRKMRNCYGNNHGGIECVNGQYYIFYHRQTNRSMFSRQGCAEKITIEADGSIRQVPMTSCGLNPGPLRGQGTYPAAICCNLTGAYPAAISHILAMGGRHPYITQDREDTSPEQIASGAPAPRQYISNGKNGMTAVYRYFDCKGVTKISMELRGRAKGIVSVYLDAGIEENIGTESAARTEDAAWTETAAAGESHKGKANGIRGNKAGEIRVTPAKDWTSFSGEVRIPDGVHELIFCFEGRGKMEWRSFEIKTNL